MKISYPSADYLGQDNLLRSSCHAEKPPNHAVSCIDPWGRTVPNACIMLTKDIEKVFRVITSGTKKTVSTHPDAIQICP
jgi:hypothetical protein